MVVPTCLLKLCLPQPRLQNSPYFCVGQETGAVKRKLWNEVENKETGERCEDVLVYPCKFMHMFANSNAYKHSFFPRVIPL